MEEEEGLQIAPAFKSKRKGKAKAVPREVRVEENDNDNEEDGVASASASSNNARAMMDEDHDDQDGAGNSSAVLFKKSSSKASSRKRGLGATSSPAALRRQQSDAAPTSKSSSMPTSRSRLNVSFGAGGAEDDDEKAQHDEVSGAAAAVAQDISAVKRPSTSSSRKLKRPTSTLTSQEGTDKTLSSSMSQASISSMASPAQPSRPSYSKDYLAELKASTQSTPSSTRNGSSSASGYDALTLSKFGSSAMQEDNDASAMLPTESAIAAAKARRETARRLGINSSMDNTASSDFISLEIGPVTSKRESRLVREEDEIGEGEDDHAEFTGANERIPLGKKPKAALEKRRKEGILEAIDLMDEDMLEGEEDEEARKWELAQIRRGEQRRQKDEDLEKEPYRAAAIPEVSSLPNLFSTTSRLTSSLKELQISKAEYDTLTSNMAREKASLDQQEKELRQEVERVNSKFEWYTETRGWVEDVASFLDEKYPLLEKVEDDNLSIQRERLDLIAKRRFMDDSDDLASFTGASIPIAWDGGKASTAGSDSKNDDDVDEDMQVDEFGRTREGNSGLEARSLARRTRRQERSKRTTSASPNGSTAAAGTETDDELTAGDSQDLVAAGEALRSDASAIFADVQAEEFRDPTIGVRPKFEEWKKRYGEDYANAFAGLAMVTVWEFWARTELADWNPFGVKELTAAPPSLDAYQWHEALSSYQHARANSAGPAGEAALEETGDNVVADMVATVVLPRLRKLAVDAYDPYSSKATGRALAVVEEMTYCVEPNSAKFDHLIQGFLWPFRQAISRLQSLVVPHLEEIAAPMAAMDVEAIEARNRFSRHLVKLLSNALRWRKYTRGLVLGQGEVPSSASEDAVQGFGTGQSWEPFISDELVEKTLLPVLEAGWETGGEEIAGKVLSFLPPNAMKSSVRSRLERRA